MRRVPQRMCIGCRSVRSKRDLMRVVRSPEGAVHVDYTGKANGRGAYLCRNRLCWQKAIGRLGQRGNSRLAAALHASLSEAEYRILWDHARELPEVPEQESNASTLEAKGGQLSALCVEKDEPVQGVPAAD
jgi:predicted RNA-binding protein YlxR (DUF448 family)